MFWKIVRFSLHDFLHLTEGLPFFLVELSKEGLMARPNIGHLEDGTEVTELGFVCSAKAEIDESSLCAPSSDRQLREVYTLHL